MSDKMLKVVNSVLFLSVVIQALTGLAMMLHVKVLHDVYEEFHEINGVIFGVLVLSHIFLNWGWIKRNYLKIS